MTETVITMNGLTNRFEYRSRSPERVMAIVELVVDSKGRTKSYIATDSSLISTVD